MFKILVDFIKINIKQQYRLKLSFFSRQIYGEINIIVQSQTKKPFYKYHDRIIINLYDMYIAVYMLTMPPLKYSGDRLSR